MSKIVNVHCLGRNLPLIVPNICFSIWTVHFGRIWCLVVNQVDAEVPFSKAFDLNKKKMQENLMW